MTELIYHSFQMIYALVVILALLAYFVYKLSRRLTMFIDDATTKLTALQTAIANIPAPQPPVDPATIVSLADQQTVLNGIDAATSAATAKGPA